MYNAVLGDMTIEAINSVAKGRLMSKLGRVCMKGLWKGKKVKIFECANPEHADFIARTTTDRRYSPFFPEIYAVYESLVVSEWVEGKQITARQVRNNKTYAKQLADLLDLLHKNHTDNISHFNYVEDFVKPRFEYCCQTLGLVEFRNNVLQSWEAMSELYPPSLSHPDLSPTNIITGKNGVMKIIDNELLGTSSAPWFDLLNILFFLGEKPITNEHLSHSVKEPLLQLIRSGHNTNLLHVWLMRFAGSCFVAGDIQSVIRIARTPVEEHLRTLKVWHNLQKLSD